MRAARGTVSRVEGLVRARQGVALVLLVAFSAASLLPASMVLCFEEDGRITLETSSDGRSCAADGSRGASHDVPRDHTGLEADGQHCQVCTDVPLGTSGDPRLLQIAAGEGGVRGTPPATALAKLGPALRTPGCGARLGAVSRVTDGARTQLLDGVRLLI